MKYATILSSLQQGLPLEKRESGDFRLRCFRPPEMNLSPWTTFCGCVDGDLGGSSSLGREFYPWRGSGFRERNLRGVLYPAMLVALGFAAAGGGGL